MKALELGMAAVAANESRKLQAQAAQIALPDLLSGHSAWYALKGAFEHIKSRAREDHDVLIQVRDILVEDVRFADPYTFSFEGFDQAGSYGGIVMRFSQPETRIVTVKTSETSRRISRFGPDPVV